MTSPRQTSWSRAAIAVSLLLGACSSAESALSDDYGSSSLSEGAESESESGDTDDSDSDSGTDPNSDTGTESGESDSDGEPPASGIEDAPPPVTSCDPDGGASVLLDLGEANSEAAPVLVAESVLEGDGSVPAIPLSERVFLNRFDYGFEPAEGPALQIRGELWENPPMEYEGPQRYGLQYAISAPTWPDNERPPLALAVIVDVGAAMAGEPLELADAAFATIGSALQPGDYVSLIAAGEEPEILFSGAQQGLDGPDLAGTLANFELGSFSDLGAALELATDSLEFDDAAQSRVLLISNGHFVRDESLDALVEQLAADELFISGLGVGDPASFDNARMQQLAQRGHGSSLFARNHEQLAADLGAQLEAHLMSVALELEIELFLPPGLALRGPDLESDDALPAPRRAQLGPGESLVFQFELEACAPPSEQDMIGVEVSWIDAFGGELDSLGWERAFAQLEPASAAAKKGAATLAYARALQVYRDALDPAMAYDPLLDAVARIAEALELSPEDPELLQMSAVAAALEP